MKPIKITEQNRKRVLDIVASLPLSPQWQVVFSEVSDDYTARQRALYFRWCGEISAVTGESKDEVHHRLKRSYLVKIYYRDDHPSGYRAMIDSIKGVRDAGYKSEASTIFRQVVNLTSITDAKKKQMSEFMNDIDKECINVQIFLTQPGTPEE